MSVRFWQAVAAAAWAGLLLIAALVLAVESQSRYQVREAPVEAPRGIDAPSASPPGPQQASR